MVEMATNEAVGHARTHRLDNYGRRQAELPFVGRKMAQESNWNLKDG